MPKLKSQGCHDSPSYPGLGLGSGFRLCLLSLLGCQVLLHIQTGFLSPFRSYGCQPPPVACFLLVPRESFTSVHLVHRSLTNLAPNACLAECCSGMSVAKVDKIRAAQGSIHPAGCVCK